VPTVALETASFRADDEPILVRAALACPLCLSGAVDWALDAEEEWEPQVECTCHACGHSRSVALTADQALRLHLARHAERDTLVSGEVPTRLSLVH
jgi:hypothetical protein